MTWDEYTLKGFWDQSLRRLLHVTYGGWTLPTHWPLAYPEFADPVGRAQTLVAVETTAEILALMVAVEVQTPGVVEGPFWGGFLAM